MGKILLKGITVVLSLFILVWGISILKCDFLTWKYGSQFKTVYQENTMMGDIDYLKVLTYSKNSARVYYVSKNRAGGEIFIFSNHNGEWRYDKWERTVWSKTGSADGFVWPYIR